MLLLLLTSIVCFSIYKRKIDANKKLWQQHVAGVINQAILFDDEEEEEDRADITDKIRTLLQNRGFRDYVINELIQIKKSLSGSSTSNLKKLYENLGLDGDSLGKLHKVQWHVKAKGIQELGIMNQAKYMKEIFWQANNENELVRNESQCALVGFSGFAGLSFLNVIEYPISQWQQVQLLNKLNDVKPENFDLVKDWMQSSNESVVVFALKLARFYNCYDVYDHVIGCLQSPSLQVKLNALEYLKEMPKEDTADQIINQDYFENKVCKLTVIHALKDIGNEKQIPFLLKKLHDKDDDIKAAAAKSLSILHPLGNEYLQAYLFADENPWKAIFLQITNERTA
jgi:HEAT repeat protein